MNKIYKKLSVMVLLTFILIFFAGCGGGSTDKKAKDQTPSDAVATFFDGVKNKNTTKIESVVNAKGEDFIWNKSDLNKGNDLKSQAERIMIMSFVEHYHEFEYKIKDESVEDDKANVKVEIKTYSFGKSYKKAIEKAAVERDKIAASIGLDSKEGKKKILNFFDKCMKDNLKKDFVKEVDITLSKKDKKWMLDDKNFLKSETEQGELSETLLGDFVKIMKKI